MNQFLAMAGAGGLSGRLSSPWAAVGAVGCIGAANGQLNEVKALPCAIARALAGRGWKDSAMEGGRERRASAASPLPCLFITSQSTS